FANLVGGSQHLVGDGLESCTTHIQSQQFLLDDCCVTVVDMPGFDDTNRSDADILNMIADFLPEPGKSLIVYFHRISDVKVGGASKRNLTIFQKLCGEEVFANVAIVTTRWDQEDEAVGMARLAELKASPRLFKSVVAGGGSVVRHDGSYDSACRVLRHLISGTPKPLLIQREMITEGKDLAETTAGQEFQHDVMQQVERHRREMAELLEEM
ncbi:hypothetical protein B0H14DRAFT_2240931, partial [Mycena olivaceomarginata]